MENNRQFARTATLLFALVLGVFSPLLTHSQATSLTKSQVTALVNNHTPDSIISNAVLTRGLDFYPDESWLDALEKAGAGSMTLEALRNKIPKGSIAVRAPQGSVVSIDSKPIGSVDQSGVLTVSQLDIGDHTISAEKQGFLPDSARTTVAPNETNDIQLDLVWAGGYLSVRGLPAGAVAEIAGLGNIDRNVEEWKVQAGSYDVTATENGMLPYHGHVTVAKGEHAVVNIAMSVIPVMIPSGTLLRVNLSEPLDTSNLKDGAVFEATSAVNIYENGLMAVPRGAVFTGKVIQTKEGGSLGGAAILRLELAGVNLAGKVVPVETDEWSNKTQSKSGSTVSKSAGGAALGGLIGGVLGHGAGAAIGAGVGAAGGLAASSASNNKRIYLPVESVLDFHLTAGVMVQPIAWREAQRLESARQPSGLMSRPDQSYPTPNQD